MFIITFCINNICVAWTTGGNNQTASIFAAKLEWNPEETRFNNSLINFSSQLGKMIGAFTGGYAISYGRKWTFLIFNVFSLVSGLLMQIVTIYTLSIGKFLNGIFVTIVKMAQMKMIVETIPEYLLGHGIGINCFLESMGYFMVFILGAGLPQGDYNPELTDDPENLEALRAN